jgi:hypothetical protein
LRMKEAILINQHHPSLNRKEEVNHFNLVVWLRTHLGFLFLYLICLYTHTRLSLADQCYCDSRSFVAHCMMY